MEQLCSRKNELSTMQNFMGPIPTQTLTTRFVFDASKLASLKAKLGIESKSSHQQTTTSSGNHLETCCCCFYQSKPDDDTASKLAVLSQMVNLRAIEWYQRYPQNEMGNWFWALIVNQRNETEKHEFVINIEKGLTDLCQKANRSATKNLQSRNGINLYKSTSECKFPLYEIDFGGNIFDSPPI